MQTVFVSCPTSYIIYGSVRSVTKSEGCSNVNCSQYKYAKRKHVLNTKLPLTWLGSIKV